MAFLLFLIHVIGISFFALFLYRYEQFNQFQIMPYEKGLYVIDKKHKTITHCDDKSCRLVYQKPEQHDSCWGFNTQAPEKSEKQYNTLQPMPQKPQPPKYQQQPLPSTYEPQQPATQNRNTLPPIPTPTVDGVAPTAHFATNDNTTENMTYNAANNIAQEPSNYENILNHHDNQNTQQNDDDRNKSPYS